MSQLATATRTGGGTKFLLFLVLAGVAAWILPSIVDVGPAHTNNGDRSERQEVEFRANWAPEEVGVDIEYLINFLPGETAEPPTSPWSYAEVTQSESLYRLMVKPRAPMSYVECSIWVNGNELGRDRSEGLDWCDIRVDTHPSG